MERLIFHIDVNNAFLSWTAVDMLKNGASLDIRTIPAIIGGDESQRHGVVLAKSNIAKVNSVVINEVQIGEKENSIKDQVVKGIPTSEEKNLKEYLSETYNVKEKNISIS